MIGRRLGHYRVVERLGAGGMGEVYRAHDEKLGRDVALKVLPAGALADEAARRRFRKEAQTLSRLNHPHIAALFDADSVEGTDFLVMELVPGATLEQELLKGPLPEKEVLRLGTQLARGLMAAHERGVVHRDLKPSNLGLTADGLLKVLDFGVAYLERGARAGQEEHTETGPGAVVGSPPYMSPEQLLGKEVDARSDLYAAGAVLYELATGTRPFGTKRGVELHDAVLHEAPPSPREVNGRVTPGLEALIVKALDKDPGLRYQASRELLVDLERLQSATGSSSSAPRVTLGSRWRRPAWRTGWLAALVALAAAVAWVLWPSPPLRISGVRPVTSGLRANNGPFWASDGTRVYYSIEEGNRSRFYQVPISGGESTEIPIPVRHGVFLAYLRPGTLLMGGFDAWPDERSQGFPLWLATLGGSMRPLANLAAWAVAVSPDEEQIALVHGPPSVETWLGLARADGSGLRDIVKVHSDSLAWAPDGEHLRFTAPGPAGHDKETWHWETSVHGEAPRPLWPGEMGQRSLDGRHFVFCRKSATAPENLRTDLWAVREAPFFHWPRPEPFRLSAGPLSFSSPGFGPDGRLLAWGELSRGELLRYDAGVRRFEPCLGGISAHFVDVSPDGQWAVYVTYPNGELWKSRIDGTEKRQLRGAYAFQPRWSPDGRSIAFVARAPEEAGLSLRRMFSDGSGEEILARPEEGQTFWDVCWLPDAETLVLAYQDSSRPGVRSLDLRTKRMSLLPGSEKFINPKCSRRGDLMAQEPDSSPPRQWIRWRGRVDWEPLDLPMGWPNWTKDGEAIIGLNGDARRVERFSFKTRTSTTVADLSGMQLAAPSYWMGLAADDSPLVLSDHGLRDLYVLELSGDGRGP